jgi:hypothetical protein
MQRRTFLKCAGASATALSLVPSHVLGAAGQTPPSRKLTLALIGCGTQGLREMIDLLPLPNVQVVAVCDPNKDSDNYVDWSKDGLRSGIANAIGKPDWRAGTRGIPGGRDVAREMVELYYANQRGAEKYKGCAVYADFRELLDKESGLDAVKIMTPDHLHATIALAAMRKGKAVMVHKPLANRLREARLVIETARQTKVPTHFLPASASENIRAVAEWIRAGHLGALREIHNWSNRPVWPQYPVIPQDTPPVPDGFDWDLWLGPSQPRPYHPHYTHAVFRGWYEFGGGAVADMGHYSLWPVFAEFGLAAPVWVESTPSHLCAIHDHVSVKLRNDYAFPAACTIRFRFAAKGKRPGLDLFWYDGGIRPPTPEELEEDHRELPAEGLLFVCEKGRILAGFLGEAPAVIPQSKNREFQEATRQLKAPSRKSSAWVQAFQGGEPTVGNFLLAGPISEAFNLGAVSLRLGGKRLVWDSANMKITNTPEANAYLTREYRPGWEI